MERALREELKGLSKELLGGPNRYRKLMETLVDGNEVSSNGKPIKVVKRLSEEEVLELLRGIKQEQEQAALAEQVQKEAGSVGQ